MDICIFKMPDYFTTERWIELLSEVIGKSYRLLSRGIAIVKQALIEATDSNGAISYASFIEKLDSWSDNLSPEEQESRKLVASRIIPICVNDNVWTTVFDNPDAPGVEKLPVNKLREMLHSSNDSNFSRLVLNLWMRLNLPEHYEHTYR